MPEEQIEPIERQETFTQGGREVRMYVNVKTGACRFEGFRIFERGGVDPITGMEVVRRFPIDFNIEADSVQEAFEKFDARTDDVLEALKKESQGPRIIPVDAGAENLIETPGGG